MERVDRDRPLVSVITASYRASGTLAECLRSVQRQSYPLIEHIVVDGGSDDGTVELLRAHSAPGMSWVSEPDGGIYDAWNKGLHRARGEWIAFLGADDVFLPGAVSGYMDLAANHPEAMYLSGRVEWIGPGGVSRVIGQAWDWSVFRRYMCTAHVGSMHRRCLFEALGEYDTSYRGTADYELLLRAREGLQTAFLPRITARMLGGGATDSSAALDEAARAKRETGGRSRSMTEFELLHAKALFYGRGFMSRVTAKMHGV